MKRSTIVPIELTVGEISALIASAALVKSDAISAAIINNPESFPVEIRQPLEDLVSGANKLETAAELTRKMEAMS